MSDRPPKRALADPVSFAFRSKERPIAPQEERRSGDRFPCTVAAEVFEPQSHARILGRTTDLGIGGCYVDTINPLPIGTRVVVRLTDQARRFEAHAQVIFAQVGMGMGLAFTEISADQLETLRQWIGELSGELPPPAASPMPSLKEYAAGTSQPTEQPFRASDHLVLNHLISLLIRKRLLTEAEGTALLRELFR